MKVASLALATIVFVELGLQLAALLATRPTGAWRPGSTHRILCVGDSHTWGAGVARDSSYPGQLQQVLDAAGHRNHSVINLGLPGMNTAQVRNRLSVWISRYQPDLVVVWAGINNFWNVAEVDVAGATSRLWLERLALNSRVYRFVRVWLHDRQLKRYRVSSQTDLEYQIADGPPLGEARNDRPYVVQHDGIVEEIQHLPAPDAEESGEELSEREAAQRIEHDLAAIRDITRAAGLGLVFITYPLELGGFQRANAAVGRVAQLYDVPIVHSHRAVNRIPKQEQTWKWGAHPSGPMYTEIARDLLPVVLDLTQSEGDTP